MLPERAKDELKRVGEAEVVVGIPSYNNEDTVGHVAGTAAKGVLDIGAKGAIVLSDGSEGDGTIRAFAKADTFGVPKIAFKYEGIPGKGSAVGAILEAGVTLGVKAVVLLDADLRSVTPEWVRLLAGPILEGRANFVAPLYRRHKFDGTITNLVCYPMVKAFTRTGVRQPIGGDFGISGKLAEALVKKGKAWETDVARFGIDIWITLNAIFTGGPICEAALGLKIHNPKDPSKHLAPMFEQVVKTLFETLHANRHMWFRQVRLGRVGDYTPLGEPEPVEVNIMGVWEKASRGIEEILDDDILGGFARKAIENRGVDEQTWADALLSAFEAFGRGERDIVRKLYWIYLARFARFAKEAERLTTEEAEGLVEHQAETICAKVVEMFGNGGDKGC